MKNNKHENIIMFYFILIDGSLHIFRTNKKQIEITELNKTPELIDYKIKTITGVKELSNFNYEMAGNYKLEGFWNFYQKLYKF